VQQLLLEGLLIGVSGGLVGILLAPAAIRVLVHRMGDAFVSSLDARLLLFNFGIAIGVSIFFQPCACAADVEIGPDADTADAEHDGLQRNAWLPAPRGGNADRTEPATAGGRGIVRADDAAASLI
jgi:hypothetical protein